MAISARAKNLVAEIAQGNLKLGDLKKRGAEIKKDHDLAMELWATGKYQSRKGQEGREGHEGRE